MIESVAFHQQVADYTAAHFAKVRAYLFYGQTPFLSEEDAQVLVNKAKTCGYTQRDIFYVDNRTRFSPIVHSLQSAGLFDPKKIIELRLDTEKPTKITGEQLVAIASHQSDNLIVIQAHSLSYAAQKTAWFKQLLSHAVAVVAKPIYANQLPNWIHQRAQQLGIALSSDALKQLMRYSEGNLLWTNQMLMQLTNSDYEQPIAIEVITNMLADMSVFQIEDLTQAMFQRQPQSIKVVQKLAQENAPLVLITTVLFREFTLLAKIACSGLPFTQACQQFRVWQSKQRHYQTALNHYTVQHIDTTLQQLATLDKINKGQHRGDGWLALQRLVSGLLAH